MSVFFPFHLKFHGHVFQCQNEDEDTTPVRQENYSNGDINIFIDAN
jgi:hypothetical protein